MARSLRKTTNIRLFSFTTELESTARKFRDYCHREGYIIGSVLDDAIVNYLIEKKVVLNREVLENEEKMNK